ncbi:MAG: TRAP transporter large permease [Betaproteobacteria bacterium]|nr:MAG: TRAP transporter large permease [Betaproteobacteria bacterium]
MEVVALYLLLPLFVLLALGVPIAFGLGLSCAFFLALINIPGLGLVPRAIPMNVLISEMYGGLNQFALLALPMFVLAGELMYRFLIIESLINLARRIVGWVPGGLAHATIIASALFAFITGSALATAASIGPTMIPVMVREKYPNDFAGAVVAAAAILGPIIPPSTPMIIVGSQLGISIGGLFAAGVVPGLLIVAVMMIYTFFVSRRRGYGEVRPFEGARPLARSTLRAVPAMTVPLVLLGGIFGGVFTPTEAGAVTVFYALLLGVTYFRTADGGKILEALRNTAKVTASVLLIIASAMVFNRLMTYFRVPQTLLEYMLSMSKDPVVIGIVLIAFLLAIGTFMDEVSNMIILGPLLMPICTSPQGLGMHPIQYGVFLIMAILLGLLTPPLSLLLNVAAPIAKVSIERLAIVVLPFMAVQVAIVFLIAFYPPVTLWLPRLLGY